ncbi:MAG TPA: AI-2E family transporter [Gemmataceae bacterium]|nr:AI-2E family transporter [Gemmataceae bacterium]
MHLSEWQRAVIALAATVVTVSVVAALYIGRSVLIPIALAIFFTFVLSPLVARLERRGLGRTLSVILVVLIVGGVSAGSGAVIAQQMSRLSDDVLQEKQTAKLKEKLIRMKHSVVGNGESKFGQLLDDIGTIFGPKPQEGNTVVLAAPQSTLSKQIASYMDPATELLGQAAFTFILTVFMLLKREDLRNRIIRLIGRGRVTHTTKAVDDGSKRVSKYLLMQLMVNATFGVVISVGLWLMGVQYGILWGFIATLMRYVPYIGTWVGLIPPTLFALAMYDEMWKPVGVFALFVGLEAACNNLIEPKLYGKSMGLSEVAQLIAAAFWAFLWGPIGLILSGPLTVCLLVLGKYVTRLQFLEVLLGDEPALEPREAFYQRLVGRDQDEASEIALKLAEESKPEDVFDQVVIPAMCMARRDHEVNNIDAGDLKFAVTAAREIGAEVADTVVVAPVVPDEYRPRVLLCPARDELDHVGIDLLAHLISPAQWEVEIAADETLASELLARVEKFRPEVVVLGALPPGGLSHTRYIATRLKKTFPDVKLIIGRWGRGDEFPEDTAKPGVSGADSTDATLAETRARLGEWRAVLEDAKKPAAPVQPRADRGAEKTAHVGTPGASV